MKRFAIIGCMAALGLFAYACGSSGGSEGPNCAKYQKCCDAIGGSTATTCDTDFGANSSCNVSAATETSCEASCASAYSALQTEATTADAGNAAACPN